MDTNITPKVLNQPFANNGTKNDIPDANTGNQRASLNEGFPAITSIPIADGGIPPERADFNGMLNQDSQFYYFTQNGGVYTYRDDVATAIGGYPKDAILAYFPPDEDGVVQPMVSLRSAKANNLDNFNTDPSFIGTSWVEQKQASAITYPLLAEIEVGGTLTGNDAFGWGVEGSTCTNAYPAFAFIQDQFTNGSDASDTFRGITINYKLGANGKKVIDASSTADMDALDQLWNTYHNGDYYVYNAVDNNIILPRRNKRELVYSFKNEWQWANVYSDGWCEQGGFVNVINALATITLFVPYIDATYSVFRAPHWIAIDNNSISNYTGTWGTKTTTSFQFYTAPANYTTYNIWRTAGYADTAGMNIDIKNTYFRIGNNVDNEQTVLAEQVVADVYSLQTNRALRDFTNVDIPNLPQTQRRQFTRLSVPDFSAPVALTWGTTYTAPTDVFVVCSAAMAEYTWINFYVNGTNVNGIYYSGGGGGTKYYTVFMGVVGEGDTFNVVGNSRSTYQMFPLKGV